MLLNIENSIKPEIKGYHESYVKCYVAIKRTVKNQKKFMQRLLTESRGTREIHAIETSWQNEIAKWSLDWIIANYFIGQH
jgi:hypothetical protein